MMPPQTRAPGPGVTPEPGERSGERNPYRPHRAGHQVRNVTAPTPRQGWLSFKKEAPLAPPIHASAPAAVPNAPPISLADLPRAARRVRNHLQAGGAVGAPEVGAWFYIIGALPERILVAQTAAGRVAFVADPSPAEMAAAIEAWAVPYQWRGDISRVSVISEGGAP